MNPGSLHWATFSAPFYVSFWVRFRKLPSGSDWPALGNFLPQPPAMLGVQVSDIAIGSSLIKSCTVLLLPSWDVSRPFTQLSTLHVLPGPRHLGYLWYLKQQTRQQQCVIKHWWVCRRKVSWVEVSTIHSFEHPPKKWSVSLPWKREGES